MSRIEATIPEPRFEQVRRLEEELGLSKSQIIDEALALFLKAIAETRQGHRVGFVGQDKAVREFTSPTLSLVEWAVKKEPLVLSNQEFDRVQALTQSPPKPTEALKRAMGRKRRA